MTRYETIMPDGTHWTHDHTTLDRNDAMFREAMDQAARVAEWLLDHHNDDAGQELALDVLADYGAGLAEYVGWNQKRIAWAFALTEKRTDLKRHEEWLLEDAWQRVKNDAAQRQWEEMGL